MLDTSRHCWEQSMWHSHGHQSGPMSCSSTGVC